MQLKFFGNDLGIFVFGQEILKQFPQAKISFYLAQKSSELEYNNGGACPSVEIQNKNFISENKMKNKNTCVKSDIRCFLFFFPN